MGIKRIRSWGIKLMDNLLSDINKELKWILKIAIIVPIK